MKSMLRASLSTGLALTFVMANAQTAHPRVIAGFDHAALPQVLDVLAAFCKENGCNANSHGQLIIGNTTPISVGVECSLAGHNYDYCVQAWGNEGTVFMNPTRTQQLKAMLEAKGAKVILMDCHFGWGNSGPGSYVCADGGRH